MNSRHYNVASWLTLFVRDWLSKFYSHVTKSSKILHCSYFITLQLFLPDMHVMSDMNCYSDILFHQVNKRPPHNLHYYIHYVVDYILTTGKGTDMLLVDMFRGRKRGTLSNFLLHNWTNWKLFSFLWSPIAPLSGYIKSLLTILNNK